MNNLVNNAVTVKNEVEVCYGDNSWMILYAGHKIELSRKLDNSTICDTIVIFFAEFGERIATTIAANALAAINEIESRLIKEGQDVIASLINSQN
ncbi:MAG: hypothetical protein ACP5OG_03000 [Candidatus Nanoarchaeia archaeon]